MILANFRTNFPEFTDITAYPDSQLTFWSGVAEKLLDEDIWQDMYTDAVMLYTAHELVLARQALLSATVGGVPGQSGGIANTKTVGSVSVGYDSAGQSEKDAGWWNMTNYGKQLYRLIKVFGAGCIQL